MKLYVNENEATYRNQARLALFSFLLTAPALAVSLISAFVSGKMITWVDAIGTLGDTVHAAVVFLISVKLAKETGDRYNFGLGRLEVFMSFICDVLISSGFLIILFSSVYSLFFPPEQTEPIFPFCLYKAVNVLFDTVLYIRQKALYKAHPSRLVETEITAYRNCIIGDTAVGLIAAVSHIFRFEPWTKYFSPAATALLILYLLFGLFKHIRGSVEELNDVSLPLTDQDEIYDIILQNRQNIIKKIDAVNCRKLNGRVYIDVCLQLHDEITYLQQKQYLTEIQKQITVKKPDAEVRLVLDKR